MNYIAEAHGLWYEGNTSFMQLIQQNGLLLPTRLPDLQGPHGLIFREDHFDPATRIRRGRLYEQTDASWTPANVTPRPYPDFHINTLYKTAECQIKEGWTAVLGDNNAQSYWMVVFSEKAGLDAHYLTLKSKTYFGVLPEVNRDIIPAPNRQDILRALEAVVEAAPIQAPQPVIDACRYAASCMISAQFPESNPTGEKDLGPMVRWLNGNKHRTKANTADIVNSLHSRAKANAAAQHGTRPVSQQDANLAVDAIAFLLQDFGWAETMA